ncbi:MAG: hypothetical protein IPG00_09935 [Saprospiraceae bacterium]|nr:hypothetical protein [Saprospiraceae bacterium]
MVAYRQKVSSLASATYKEGPDQFGGGGDDANTEHVYEVSIDNFRTTDAHKLFDNHIDRCLW